MKICKVDGCESKHKGKGYCGKHYMQIKMYGGILERTIHDRNEIVIKENYAEIVLYNIKHKEIGRTLISLEDIEKVKKYKWCFDGKGYVIGKIKGKTAFLHRLLLNPPRDKVIDHINHITIDNRRCNLRVCTREENQMNRKSRGYYWNKLIKKWQVQIRFNGKRKSIGCFKTEEEAKRAREQAEIKYYKEFRIIKII